MRVLRPLGERSLFGGFLARAVLLSGGVHAFLGASDHERNDNILKGRWRWTRADETFPCQPLRFE